MSVDHSDGIDAIGIERTTGNVILTIADHLDWTDADAHEIKLQAKLNAYLRFVESGQMLDAYPNARGRVVVFDVVLRVPPTPRENDFFDRVRQILADAGFELRARVLPEA